MHYQSWCDLSDDDLAARDIAEVNLACGYGLPWADDLDVRTLCGRVDEWAGLVDKGTQLAWSQRNRPEYDHLSDDQFRILVMVTILQRNLVVKYNAAFSEGPYDGSDSRNLFIHGMLCGHGGTCATMPVLYTAVGRRLGYPLKLATAKEHMFCRWDDSGGEQFNIEATSQGFRPRTDAYYLNWPKPLTPKERDRGWYLRSLSPRRELAEFLCQRGHCWLDNLQTLRAVEAYYHAHQLAPDVPGYENHWGWAIIIHRAVEQMDRQGRIDPRSTTLCMPAPREEWERRMYPAAHEQLNRILANRRARRIAVEHDHVFALSESMSHYHERNDRCTTQRSDNG